MVATATIATVRRFPAEVIVVSSYEELHVKRTGFETKVADGTATRVDLIWYILTIDEAGHETIPQSMGMQWIHHNPTLFARIVGDVEEFLEELLGLAEINPMNDGEDIKAWDGLHGLRYWFFRSFLLSKELMKLLTPGWREIFVRDLYPKLGAHNNSWISAAVLNGVSRETIATAILQRLRRVTIKPGMANDVDDFLRYGGGHDIHTAPVHAALRSLDIEWNLRELRDAIAKDPSTGFPEIERRLRDGITPRTTVFGDFPEIPPWFALSNAELAEALQICATKAPGETLKVLRDERIRTRLDNIDASHIVRMAASHMTSLSGISLETLERLLTLSERESLARQLRPVEEHYLHKATAQFLFNIVCDLSLPDARLEFWNKVVEPVLKPVSAATVYKAWRQMERKEDGIEARMRVLLNREGYVIGNIRRGSHKRKIQWYVDHRGVRFVQNRYEHRYFPAEDDLVLFHPDSGRHLTPAVISVSFTPVMKDLR